MFCHTLHFCISAYKIREKKKRWTNEEKVDAKKYFFSYVRKGKLPPLREIENIKATHNILIDRKPDVIKTWLHNQIRKTKISKM